jgi:cytochrome c-type biogenesis protein CcmH
VLDFLVSRYGQFVLLRPRFEWQTALLWLTPFAALIGGAIVLGLVARRRSGIALADSKLSAAEEARVSELMQSSED